VPKTHSRRLPTAKGKEQRDRGWRIEDGRGWRIEDGRGWRIEDRELQIANCKLKIAKLKPRG
jgi:hypothetical protein